MKDEIKEILDKLNNKAEHYILYNYEVKLLLDYITNLQEELKEYKMLFDAFSERPYAHRYLEEKKKELGNSKIIGLDSEMIYKDYYDLKQENERLHKELDYANNDNIYYIAKIDKAINYIKSFEDIKAYYCYEECGYDEYNTDDDFKNDLLNILNGDDKYE